MTKAADLARGITNNLISSTTTDNTANVSMTVGNYDNY